MRPSPDVSVVMAVYNGGAALAETLDSVLSQAGVALELVVVNDGSSDGSGALLDAYAARDSRVRVLHQANTGLTRALISGCRAARADLIARQDAGDVSLPGRLAAQVAHIRARSEAVMSACGVRTLGPGGEPLYEVGHGEGVLDRSLRRHDDWRRLHGPAHHGATLFCARSYRTVGGYRAQFRVAQDLDLWMRLAEIGSCLSMPDVLYQARLSHGSISASRRPEQMAAKRAIIACARCRRAGGSDVVELANWEARARHAVRRWLPQSKALDDACLDYFVASALRRSNPGDARRYYASALRRWPLHMRSWAGLARLALRPRSAAGGLD